MSLNISLSISLFLSCCDIITFWPLLWSPDDFPHWIRYFWTRILWILNESIYMDYKRILAFGILEIWQFGRFSRVFWLLNCPLMLWKSSFSLSYLIFWNQVKTGKINEERGFFGVFLIEATIHFSKIKYLLKLTKNFSFKIFEKCISKLDKTVSIHQMNCKRFLIIIFFYHFQKFSFSDFSARKIFFFEIRVLKNLFLLQNFLNQRIDPSFLVIVCLKLQKIF